MGETQCRWLQFVSGPRQHFITSRPSEYTTSSVCLCLVCILIEKSTTAETMCNVSRIRPKKCLKRPDQRYLGNAACAGGGSRRIHVGECLESETKCGTTRIGPQRQTLAAVGRAQFLPPLRYVLEKAKASRRTIRSKPK